jgi:hypothetical protein
MTIASETSGRVIQATRILCDQLWEIAFEPLQRPPYNPKVGRSKEEILWALRVFACPSMYSFRDLLNGFILAYDNRSGSTCFILARAIMETIAMANYVRVLAEPLIKKQRWDRVWRDVLERASAGSYYVLNHGKNLPEHLRNVLPLDIGKAVKSLDSVGEQSSAQEYSYLSELAHPSSLVLDQYVEMSPTVRGARFHPVSTFREKELQHMTPVLVSLAGLVYIQLFSLAQMPATGRDVAKMIKAFLVDSGNPEAGALFASMGL